jgi:hypothetical protein
MLLARLQLRAPEARLVLVVPARSSLDVTDVVQGLSAALESVGEAVHVLDLRSLGGDGAAHDGDRPTTLATIRAALRHGSGYTLAFGGGVLDTPAALLASQIADGVLVVVRAGKTYRSDLAVVRGQVERDGGRLLGAVVIR